MIDTGSAKSIIHINTLYKLIHRPYINYQNRLHSTANNGELRTIGSVNLRIRLKNILTFILAEVAIDLCTGLVLGNDWISKNEIDIITTQKCIRKRRGSYVATIPFSNYYQEAYPVYPIYSIHTLPKQRVKTLNKPDLKCRTCYERYKTKKQLFEHLHRASHYVKRETKVLSTLRSISTQTGKQSSIIGAITTRRIKYRQQQREPIPVTTTTTRPDQRSNLFKPTDRISVFTNEQLKFYQQRNNSIKKIIENIYKTPFRNQYCINNGILCRNVKRINRIIAVPVIPREKMYDVLLAYHDSSLKGEHLGNNQIYYKIRNSYYWPRIYEDIIEFVKSCSTCTIDRYSRRNYGDYRTNEIYLIGDFVYVKRLGLNHKLSSIYDGPYQIIEQSNESIYRLQNPNELNEIFNAHTDRLHRCY
ncbi:unnamed protein product [Rotaria magnacalcarata]